MAYNYRVSNRGLNKTRVMIISWGIPVFVGFLIVLWYTIHSDSLDEQPVEPNQPTEQSTEQPAQSTEQPAAPTPGPSTAQPGSTQPTPAGTAGTTPTNPVQPVAPVSTVESYPSGDYDFTKAVIGDALKIANISKCTSGIIVDPLTRKVLWAKAPDKAVPIASMTKMMTLLLVEDAITAGRVTLETPIRVTKAAYEIGGSQVWLDPKETFPLGELLKTIAIKSANDSAYLVGEYLANGDMPTFIKQMNAKAKTLGMTNTTFYDAHGLCDSKKRNNTSSAHDMILLAEQLLKYDYLIKLASTPMESFRKDTPKPMIIKNHNNLITKKVPGVDGLKTGYTKASGFCVAITCKRNGRRLIGCVNGFPSAKDRDAFATALLNWAYEQGTK